MIQLIVYGQEEKQVSSEAKEWFYNLVSNGDKGPFVCESFNDKSKTITLPIAEDQQIGLF
jgi:hypothetical protein